MKKGKKLFIFVLIVTVFLVPMLTSCEPEPEVDHVAEAKQSFLSMLKIEGPKAATGYDKIVVEITGADIAVTFKVGADGDDILEVAGKLVDKLEELTKAGTKVVINEKTYELHVPADLPKLKTDMSAIFLGGDGEKKTYSATVKYNNQEFTLTGELKVTDNR